MDQFVDNLLGSPGRGSFVVSDSDPVAMGAPGRRRPPPGSTPGGIVHHMGNRNERYTRPFRAPAKKSIKDLVNVLNGRRLFIQVDFNVPQDEKDPNIIADTDRIDAALPTIKYAFEHGARSVVLCFYLGHPDGEKNKKLSMEPVADVVAEKLGRTVMVMDDVMGTDVEDAWANPEPGTVILLKESHFCDEVAAGSEEVKNFDVIIAKLADIYCSDSLEHLAHNSMVGEGFPIKCSGLLLAEELAFFANLASSPPSKPLCCILAGAKVTDKIEPIMDLLGNGDIIIIGGATPFTLIKNADSPHCDEERAKELVSDMRQKAEEKGVALILPVDFKCRSTSGQEDLIKEGVMNDGVMEIDLPNDYLVLDIGPKSIEMNIRAIENAKMTVFEMVGLEEGARQMMETMVKLTKQKKTMSVICGDTALACKNLETIHKVSHCSTGGATTCLQLLAGKKLPGVTALDDRWLV